MPDRDSIAYLRRVLIRWYRASRRDLPWRRTKDPYRIWLSEIMLQQTRVAAATSYYRRFLHRFPTVQSLAAAPIDEVLAEWAGLGYYRRARHLKAAAEIVMEVHGGRVPSEEMQLLALPGIGRYTAGAIRSIAFDLRAPILDGNVHRVTARFFRMSGRWTSVSDRKEFWSVADALVPQTNPGDFNQAMMEWGALICTPKSPDCSHCPVRKRCGALASNSVDQFPTPRPKVEMVRVSRALYVVSDKEGRVLIKRRPDSGRMAGMWDLPETVPSPVGQQEPEPIGRFGHSILNKRYRIDVYQVSTKNLNKLPGEDHEWVAREKLTEYPLTTMAKKGLELADRQQPRLI